jgi:hypothetical protein
VLALSGPCLRVDAAMRWEFLGVSPARTARIGHNHSLSLMYEWDALRDDAPLQHRDWRNISISFSRSGCALLASCESVCIAGPRSRRLLWTLTTYTVPWGTQRLTTATERFANKPRNGTRCIERKHLEHYTHDLPAS